MFAKGSPRRLQARRGQPFIEMQIRSVSGIGLRQGGGLHSRRFFEKSGLNVSTLDICQTCPEQALVTVYVAAMSFDQSGPAFGHAHVSVLFRAVNWPIRHRALIEIKPAGLACGLPMGVQLTRFQVWPPQNMPPKAQPWTRSAFVPFIAIVES